MTPFPFLTARWRFLAMLNFEIDAAILRPLVPAGTELDLWRGAALASVVGFRFLSTRVCGAAIPFHRDFEEVNLRFYVRRYYHGEWRRGVAFVRELVPRPAIAAVARVAYNEPYLSLPMRHCVRMENAGEGGPGMVRYGWHHKRWQMLEVETMDAPQLPARDSHQAWIAEHYWGYTQQRDGGCREYRVAHRPWRIWQGRRSALDCDAGEIFGARFQNALASPISAFVAEGSPVKVYRGELL